MSDVRVRFAPSPTGHLHIGGARTATYNWAFARGLGGTFVLRIDDTDPERSTDANTKAILSSLRWLGLDWDEGPEAGGEHGPYFQTQRAAMYAAALERLKAGGHTYPCFCSVEELEAARGQARASGGFAGYSRACRAIPAEEAASRVAAGERHVWRLAVPLDRGEVGFTDAVRGETRFPADVLDDFVLVRSDGTPTYNFASVVDDADMAITDVIRGDDHLSNTPKQILVFESLGAPIPTFAHLSMILGADGKRLSKRHGATSVEAYRETGYLPEALVNYLALLGWSLDDKTTLFTAEELARDFSLERVSRNPAIFDPDKLEWMNGVYIRGLSPAALADRMVPWLEAAGLLSPAEAVLRRPWLEELASLVNQRLKRMDEIVPMAKFLLEKEEDFRIEDAARKKALSTEASREAIEAIVTATQNIAPEDFTFTRIEEEYRKIPEELGMEPKEVFQAVRVAASGSTVSPPLFQSIELLGKDRTLERLKRALAQEFPKLDSGEGRR